MYQAATEGALISRIREELFECQIGLAQDTLPVAYGSRRLRAAGHTKGCYPGQNFYVKTGVVHRAGLDVGNKIGP